MTEPDYERLAVAAGWALKSFDGTVKWYNPENDDGSRYLDHPRHIRYLCEDHGLVPERQP